MLFNSDIAIPIIFFFINVMYLLAIFIQFYTSYMKNYSAYPIYLQIMLLSFNTIYSSNWLGQMS